jgi:hypothetical protein
MLGGAFSALVFVAVAAANPKHVVMTVIDDLGFDDFGFANGGQINTPTFNAMHDSGVHFVNYYVQPSCSPTRATIMVHYFFRDYLRLIYPSRADRP